jgi:hypothetical protein
MKRFLCFLVLLAAGLTSAYSQGDLRLGVNAGVPVGDAADVSSFNAGADVAYLMGFGDTFQVGPMVGYSHFFGDDDSEDFQFLPIAATARFGLAGLELGLDLGYGLGISDDLDGGFYYRPKIGFGLFGLSLIGSYTGISDDSVTFSTVNVGLEFRL